jgi:membrane-associated phospholipid phosphatase
MSGAKTIAGRENILSFIRCNRFVLHALVFLFFSGTVTAAQEAAGTPVTKVAPKTSAVCPSSSRRNYSAPSGCFSSKLQEPISQSQPSSDSGGMSFKKVFLNLPGDQKTIWTSPLHQNKRAATWLVPFLTINGLLIASDRRNMAHERSNIDAVSRSNNIANGGLLALTVAPAGMYLWGNLNGSRRQSETGLLTAEALINSAIMNESLKRVFGRERPLPVDGPGKFFHDFSDPSFPSLHSTLSWTAASVIAHEYPGWLSQTLAYGTAGAVSVARVAGRQHFPSDVVVGGTLGWLIGRQTYLAHHSNELDDGQYGRFIPESRKLEGPQTGTTYVPIDSWVYADFDRLAALGYLNTAMEGMRPWTRTECARLVQELGNGVDAGDSSTWATLYSQLAAEFAPEIAADATLPDARIEEIYTRIGFISGQPLADDYHFAKTFTDDFGRVFGEGANAITGISGRAVVGPLAFYGRAEYQHAGTLPPLSSTSQLAIAHTDTIPFFPEQRTDSLDRVRPLEVYASLNFHGNVISFGRQSLWWGPGADGPFLFSNNAEPLPLLRITNASPILLPWIFRWLGGVRLELIWGQLNGYNFEAITDAAGNRLVVGPPIRPHPFLDGEKFSFKPTRNLEFGFALTTVFSGPGFPLTLHSFLRSYSISNTSPFKRDDPGDRRSAFDFSYRLPGLRDWATLYGDSFTEDEFSPISYPRKSSFRAGLYLPRLPKLPKIDLRAEGIYTDIPNLGNGDPEFGLGIAYFNAHYLSGYTNYGQIIGNAIGREGRGVNIWTTYHFTAENSVQLHYRFQHVNPAFMEGGHLRDFDASATLVKASHLVFNGVVKYEHWNFPLVSPTPKTNVSAGVQVSWRPLQGRSLWNRTR